MTYLPKSTENIGAGSTWNQGTMSQRKGHMSTENQIVQEARVEIDNLDPTQDQENLLALSAVQSAEEFNDAYGDQQEEHFNVLFNICWNQYESDEQTYEDWFKVFKSVLLYGNVVNPLSTVKGLKAYNKAKIATDELATLEPVTVEVEVDGETLTRTVDIAKVMRDNGEQITNRELVKSSGVWSALATAASDDPANVERKLKTFFQQDLPVNQRRSLSAVAGAGKNGIKAAKNKGGGKHRTSDGEKLIKLFDRCSKIQKEIFVQHRREELQELIGHTLEELLGDDFVDLTEEA